MPAGRASAPQEGDVESEVGHVGDRQVYVSRISQLQPSRPRVGRLGTSTPRVLAGAEGSRRSYEGGGSGAAEATPDLSRSLRPGSRPFAARAGRRRASSLGSADRGVFAPF